MNIVQLQDLLKGLPDTRLKQEMDQPTGSVPQYLVLSEIVRRDKMRTTGMAQSPTTTVVQDVMNQQPGPQAMPPEQMQQEQAPQGYASGGFISAADAMGGAGVRGFAPPAPKQPMMFGQNQPGQGMFTPNTAPKAPAPMTNNNINLTQPQPQFDGGQMNDMNSPSFYQQGAYADGGAIRYDLGGKITSAESGGNPRAKNPLSSATGAGQFISSTWLSMLEKMKPGLIDKIGKEAALELRNDPVLSKQAVDAYAAENRDFLSRRGFEPTEGNLYLAHFAGAGGASSLLGADPSAKASDILGPQVLKANPFIKDMTVADIKNWAAKKMGSKPSDAQGMAGRETPRGLGVGAGNAAVGYDPVANLGGIASLPDTSKDTMSPELAMLGKAMAGKPKERPQMDVAPIASGSAELAAGTRTISPEQQLAQYAALRRGYMANGGPVRMRDGERVPTIPSWATEQLVPDSFWDAPNFAAQPTVENPYGAPGAAEAEADSMYAPTEAQTDAAARQRGPETVRQPSPQAASDELFRRQWEEAAKPPEQPSAQEDFITYLKGRDAALNKMYEDQLEIERQQQAQATGLPAFLRQMGLGMLSDNSSMGDSLRAGLSGAMGAREDQGAEARDRIRALQLKKQMGGIETAGDIAKLKYESAVAASNAAAELANEGRMTPKDYAKLAGDLEVSLIKAMAESPDAEELLAPMRQQIAEYRRLAGMPAASGLGAIPSGVTIERLP